MVKSSLTCDKMEDKTHRAFPDEEPEKAIEEWKNVGFNLE